MKFSLSWTIALVLPACLSLSACKKLEEAEETEKPAATVEQVEGDAPARVTLTDDAVKRLDLQTAAITETDAKGTKQKVMPYSALLYDTKGDTWAFTTPQPLTYLRAPLKVERIDGDTVVLAEGPDVGIEVVTVGAAELYGSEIEFEEE